MKPANPLAGVMSCAALLNCIVLFNSANAVDMTSNGRALLIGCTTYDHLQPSLHLQGPSNDVTIMQELLCERFKFRNDRVVMLTESMGRSELRPTRANIEREFKRLGDEAQKGEQIVIFLAGHGTQQPDTNPSPDDPEPDGLDELFLPADVQAWDGGIGRVPNAIVDDELRSWLQLIQQRRAAVTVIVDSCHSGTMTRGIGERTRQVPRGVLVPLDKFPILKNSELQSPLPETPEQTRGSSNRETQLDGPSVIAIYASQSSEATVERLLPADGTDRKPHGLLTYTLIQVLERSTEPLTYRELVQQIQTQYAGSGRSSPTPMIEGTDRDREMFGLEVWPDRSQIVLSKKSHGWSINAGALQAVTAGSVFAVFSPDEKQNTMPAGHVRVQVARTVDADVVPCDHTGKPTSAAPPEHGRCEVLFMNAGDLRLRVASVADESSDPEISQQIKAMLQPESLVENSIRLVQPVESASDADWLIQVKNSDILLIPAESGLISTDEIGTRPLNCIGPKPSTIPLDDWLFPRLVRIARATNLKKVAAVESRSPKLGDLDLIELVVERSASKRRLDELDRNLLRDGEGITIRVKNPAKFPVDVSLLFIDNECRISALFPQHGEINRLQPGEATSFSTRVTAARQGTEHLVAIAVKSAREVIDYSCLADPDFQSTRTRGSSAAGSLNSDLGQLLSEAVFSDAPTRGSKRPASKAHCLKLMTWQMSP